ncbi:unnamed protein product [Symbiodinium sp. CCMP2592]|nr:unnamed protein product [Symbiodinium sp. CCMP2592]
MSMMATISAPPVRTGPSTFSTMPASEVAPQCPVQQDQGRCWRLLGSVLVTAACTKAARAQRVRRLCKPVQTMREQAELLVSDRKALRIGNGDLESLISEEEREKMTEKADTLEPYRQYVLFAAFGLILGAGNDLFWLVFQPSFFTKGFLPSGSTDESQFSRLLVILGLAAVGAGLYYVGNVVLAPAELPSVETVLSAEESGESVEEVEASRMFYRLQGRWYYGVNLGQSYSISKCSDGRWKFEEELAGRRCTSTLRVVGDWVEGHLIDDEGQRTGTIRLQRGEGNAVLSYFRELGSSNWSNPNEAIGW